MFKTTVVHAGIFLKKGLKTLWQGISHLAVSWPKAFAAAVALLVLSYYPLGGLLSENIDKTPDYVLTRESEQQSLTVETMRFLINREVNENLWTANLPLFFPSYFLDNMPNYQKGIVSALATTAAVIGEETLCPENGREKAVMNGAAELLKYPGNVWLFAPDNKLKIAPSSASQYRKARKLLRDYNRLLPAGQCFWARDNANMRGFVGAVKHDLYKTAEKLETQIAEHSSDWTDFQADDLFYYSQGKIYAYMLILKAWGTDFKTVLLDSDQYENWTKVIRALEDGSALSPLMVRNGELSSGMAANHLVVLGYYMLRAAGLLEQISYQMKGASLMRIETQLSADNDIMHFFTESGFLEKGNIEFSDAQSLQRSPLAENICRVSGVVSVLITPDCLSVTKEHNALWDELKPQVLAEIADCLTESKVAETSSNPTPADIVCHIVGLLNARIRPTIRKDGGDIVFRGFENGVVYVELQGKCVGCPYSQRTLKEGVEKLLRTYIKEVDTVEKYEN